MAALKPTTGMEPPMSTSTTAPTAAVYSPSVGAVCWRGQSLADAQAYARAQNRGCAAQGGYGDRTAYAVDEDGFLVDDAGRCVWPAHGRSSGAVRV